jgi:hypothetical protein
MRAAFECPWTGRGTSIGDGHESCGNRCHDPEPCCITCCRSCQATCLTDACNHDDHDPELRPAILRKTAR